jgi:hypothetical protein
VNLPASLTVIGDNPFRHCTSLTEINVDPGNSAYKDRNGMLLNKAGTTLIGYPAAGGTVDLSGITEVGYEAFSGCTLETVSLPAATTIGRYAFSDCTALTSVNLPAATSIAAFAFSNCKALATVSLPAATTIDNNAFEFTGTGNLTVTLDDTPPELGRNMFNRVPNTNPYAGESGPKSVTVKVPDNTAWNAIISAYNGTNTTNDNWGNAFRGGGWDGDSYLTGEVNENINLTIQVQEETP